MTELEDAVDRLHAVPLEEFVAERKRLARELRSAGDRDAAAELAKLPKPSAPAWALNHLAREEPSAVGAWLEAAEALRDASARADRPSGDALRAAIAAHREATRTLLAQVREKTRPNGRELSEPMLDRVRDLLHEATADPAAGERLRAGRVVERDGEPELAEAAGDERAAAPERATSGRAKIDRAAERRAAAEARAAAQREERETAARAELERLVADAEERLGTLREAAEEAAAAAAKADERLEEAERTLHRSQSEAAAAHEAADEAAAAAEQAERELRTLTAKLSS